MCSECGRGEQRLRRDLCHACYERARRRGTVCSGLVDATPAKAKIAELLDAGWGSRRIAKEAGIDRGLVSAIMRGRPKIAAKTRDAICGLNAEPDPAAIAHRALCEAGTRGEYVSPQRKYRQAQAARRREARRAAGRQVSVEEEDDAWVELWLAGELDEKQLAAEQRKRRKERQLPFRERYTELRHHCGLADWEIAKQLGVANMSLLRRLSKYKIRPQPEFVAMCVEEKREAAERKAALCG